MAQCAGLQSFSFICALTLASYPLSMSPLYPPDDSLSDTSSPTPSVSQSPKYNRPLAPSADDSDEHVVYLGDWTILVPSDLAKSSALTASPSYTLIQSNMPLLNLLSTKSEWLVHTTLVAELLLVALEADVCTHFNLALLWIILKM